MSQEEIDKKLEEYSVKISSAIMEVFNPESKYSLDISDLSDENLANVLSHALLNVAPSMVFKQITDAVVKDILDVNYIANRLCVEFSRIEK